MKTAGAGSSGGSEVSGPTGRGEQSGDHPRDELWLPGQEFAAVHTGRRQRADRTRETWRADTVVESESTRATMPLLRSTTPVPW